MSNADLWAFVRAHGLLGKDIAALVLGVLFLIAGVYGIWVLLYTPRTELKYSTIVSPLIAFGVSLMCCFVAWYSSRERYLLQPGKGRYTVATIYKHAWWRGRRKFVCAYFVAGQRYQTDQQCGIAQGQELPCPALGARRYIYFAPQDPNTKRVLAVPVPESVRTIPPLGWAKLP